MPRSIYLLSVPSDAGALNGTDLGPESLLNALPPALFGAGYGYHKVVRRDLGEQTGFPGTAALHRRSRGKVHRKREVVQVANMTAQAVRESLNWDAFVAVLGGDHSIAMGSCRGALEFARSRGKTLGLLWIDAHYDVHTHLSTLSHNANGMPLATLLGYGPPCFRPGRQAFLPEHVLHLGAGEKDCEPPERALLEQLGVRMIPAKDFRQLNVAVPWRALVQLLARVDLVWVSFDLDAVNRVHAPGVHLRSENGLTKMTLLWIAGHVAQSRKLCGVDIMEHKPSAEEYDGDGRGKTAMLASEFLLTLLGKDPQSVQ